MTLKKTLFMGVLLALLLVFVFRYEIPEQESKGKRGIVIGEISETSARQITIKNAKGEFALKRIGDQSDAKTAAGKDDLNPVKVNNWQMAGVAYGGLDSGSMNSLWSGLQSLKLEDPISAQDLESDLSLYGLKDPELRITVALTDREEQIDFGKSNALLSKRYVQRKGDSSVYLVTEGLFFAANKARDDFRNHLPFTFEDTDVASLSLTSSVGSSFEFTHADGKIWRMEKPIAVRAGTQAIDDALREIRTLRIEEFLEQMPTVPAGKVFEQQVVAHINFSSQFHKPTQLAFFVLKEKESAQKSKKGKDEKKTSGVPQYYVTAEGIQGAFKISYDMQPRLLKDVKAYREKRFLDYQAGAAKEATIIGEGIEPLSLKQTAPGQWTVNDKTGDGTFVLSYLDKIREAEAIDYPSAGEKIGFDKPIFSATLKFAENEERRIVVAKQLNPEKKGAAKRYVAAVGDLSEPFIISQESFDKLKPKVETLLKVEPSPTPEMTANGG